MLNSLSVALIAAKCSCNWDSPCGTFKPLESDSKPPARQVAGLLHGIIERVLCDEGSISGAGWRNCPLGRFPDTPILSSSRMNSMPSIMPDMASV